MKSHKIERDLGPKLLTRETNQINRKKILDIFYLLVVYPFSSFAYTSFDYEVARDRTNTQRSFFL